MSIERFPLALLGDDIIFQHFDIDMVRDTALELGHELYEEKGKLVNDVTFLSYKFDYAGSIYKPYYANLDKMFGSLRYTKNDITYYQKLASFHSLLVFAPPGSKEDEWCNTLEGAIEYLYEQAPQKYQSVAKCYKPRALWMKDRSYYNPLHPTSVHLEYLDLEW